MTFLKDWILDETLGLRGIFNKYRVGGIPNQPIEIKSVLYDFTKSITPNPDQLPSVSFSAGRIAPNLGARGLSNTVSESFSVIVHSTINLGTSDSMISRISDMTDLIFLVIKELDMSGQISTDPQLSSLTRVRFDGMTNNTIDVSEQNQVDYTIVFDYERFG